MVGQAGGSLMHRGLVVGESLDKLIRRVGVLLAEREAITMSAFLLPRSVVFELVSEYHLPDIVLFPEAPCTGCKAVEDKHEYNNYVKGAFRLIHDSLGQAYSRTGRSAFFSVNSRESTVSDFF
jgi:hypothetical protein